MLGMKGSKEKDEEDRYYLQDTRVYVGNNLVFCRKGGEKYTYFLQNAEVFNEEEARERCSREKWLKAWSKEVIDKAASSTISVYSLTSALDTSVERAS